jgi:L-seryl-tRNA(Ser) seleniumtransferase
MKRRWFLGAGGAASVWSALRPRYLYAAQLAASHGEIYRQLGIRPLINAAGTYTTLTGSVMPERVRDAMEKAAQCFVPLIDLQRVVGARLAKILEAEAAMVTSGAAGAIELATAACVTMGDPEKIRRIPDTTGMKNEVIVPKAHRNGFDHAARNVGVKLIEVETIEEARARINGNTAMLYWTHIFEPKGKITRKEFLAAGKAAGVPVFNDAAAELPPAENLSGIVKEGFDLVAFSGGKGLRGPQASGLLAGRKDLIEAAHLNNNPHSDTIGRGMKVGKEEIIGLLTAVEIYASRDHEADQRLWRGFMQSIEKDLKGIGGVKSEIYVPGPGGHPIPYLRVQWDQSKVRLSYDECGRKLREGEPRIEVNVARDEITLASYNLFPGEERIVGWRLREILLESAA